MRVYLKKIDEEHIFVEEQENGRVLKGNKEGDIIWEYIWDAKINGLDIIQRRILNVMVI